MKLSRLKVISQDELKEIHEASLKLLSETGMAIHSRNALELLEIISKEGIGHHWMIGYGDISQELKESCSLANLKSIIIP